MAFWTKRRAAALGVAALWLGSLGCSGGPAKPEPPKAADTKPDAPKSDPKPDANLNGAAPTPPPAAKTAPPTDDPLYHPFVEACLSADNPPLVSCMPPDMTITDKPTPKLLDAVKQHWDDIRFTTPAGKRIQYTAVFDTDYGMIEIELRPDLAPNHVRSFVALIESGYYDGMRFDRIHHEVAAQAPNDLPLDFVEAGRTLDKGETVKDTIGYWLKFENSLPLTHDVGAVGFMHPPGCPDSSACSFYIMLSSDPYLDLEYTVFGKVTAGLDKVRTMFTQPVIVEDSDSPGDNRPKDPILIHKATVRTQVVEAAGGK
ncbi:MAG TPA: peptidylprolyl isomerase [Gemmataceae bacterium]|nr:peptidylprolyl isomerase [Gemmataceae bacterium]